MSSYVNEGLDPDVKKFLGFIGMILGTAGYWLLRAIGVPMPVLLIMLLITVVAGGLGKVVGMVLNRFVDGDSAVTLCLAVSLLAAWLFAGLGIFLSILVLQLAKSAYNRRPLLLCLGYFGLLASLINGGVGAALNFHDQQQRLAAASESAV